MFEADDIRDWRGKDVVDADGSKIGTLEAVYFDTAMQLPTFTVDGMTLIKRMAWVIDDGVVAHVFYPVFPPDRSADEVVAWLKR